MERLLSVKEYEIITCNEDYREEYAYLPETAFRELEAFIRAGAGQKDDSDLLQFLRMGYRRGVGPVISACNYVGLIQLKSGYQIEILPKIALDGGEEPDHPKTRTLFMNMIQSLRSMKGKGIQNASLRVERMTIAEILICLYLQEMDYLLQKGLKSAYLRQEENLPYWKGKLLVNEHLRHNIAHQERFFAAYEAYHLNRPENRLLKATLFKLQKVSHSAQNQKKIRQQLTAFELVEASVNYDKDFTEVVADRSMREYQTLLAWSKVYLSGKSFTVFSGGVLAKALLFPMERVFEAYVAREMKRVCTQAGWEVSVQDRGYYLFDTPQRFALRPDLVIDLNDGRKIILDTKWKRLSESARGNHGIKQEDMYQMYAYAKKYKTDEVWLLCPLQERGASQEEISYQSEDGVRVRVCLVDVEHIQESLKKLLQQIRTS